MAEATSPTTRRRYGVARVCLAQLLHHLFQVCVFSRGYGGVQGC